MGGGVHVGLFPEKISEGIIDSAYGDTSNSEMSFSCVSFSCAIIEVRQRVKFVFVKEIIGYVYRQL